MNNFKKGDTKIGFSMRERFRSFKDAFSGLVILIKFEHNARIHLTILIAVIFAGFILRITTTDWIAVVLTSGMVFVSECFNSSVEYLSDVVSPGQNESIKRAKDVAAAGVLISAIISVIIGVIVFLPKLYKLFAT